jgi:hypothetical protein
MQVSCGSLGKKESPLHIAAGFLEEIICCRFVLATATELVLELLDATSGIDETLLAGESRVRIGGDIADHHLVFHIIDGFSLVATHGGTSQIFNAGRNIYECNRVELWMDISFHSVVLSMVSAYP